jgi:hypothetical protein
MFADIRQFAELTDVSTWASVYGGKLRAALPCLLGKPPRLSTVFDDSLRSLRASQSATQTLTGRLTSLVPAPHSIQMER